MEATDPLWHALGRQNKWLGKNVQTGNCQRLVAKLQTIEGKAGANGLQA